MVHVEFLKAGMTGPRVRRSVESTVTAREYPVPRGMLESLKGKNFRDQKNPWV
jgi:hypothetical protein